MTASVGCLALCFHYHTFILNYINSSTNSCGSLHNLEENGVLHRVASFFAFFFFGILRQNSHSMVQTGIQLVEVLLLQAPDLTNL